MSPKDDIEFRYMLGLALNHKGPVAIRYPRGKVPVQDQSAKSFDGFKIGESEILKHGKDVALIAVGNTVYPSLNVSERLEKEGFSVMVINARFIKPLDRNLISSVVSVVPRIVTIEDNVLQGGFGSAILEFLNKTEFSHIKIKRLGMPDKFIEQGSQEELRRIYGLDEEGIYTAVLSLLHEPIYKY
jgi:1-deoxy-D-xylulose-5-phosphate synthase